MMTDNEKWSFEFLKQEIIRDISKQVGEGAQNRAKSEEDETFREEIRKNAGKWGEEIYNTAQVAVLVPTGLFAFDQFFNLPDMDISLFGIGQTSRQRRNHLRSSCSGQQFY